MATRATTMLIVMLLVAMLMPATAAEPVKVVYHLNEGFEQAARAMTNIRNHLSADPTAKIVVAHGRGIDFLLKDAKTPTGAVSTHRRSCRTPGWLDQAWQRSHACSPPNTTRT